MIFLLTTAAGSALWAADLEEAEGRGGESTAVEQQQQQQPFSAEGYRYTDNDHHVRNDDDDGRYVDR